MTRIPLSSSALAIVGFLVLAGTRQPGRTGRSPAWHSSRRRSGGASVRGPGRAHSAQPSAAAGRKPTSRSLPLAPARSAPPPQRRGEDRRNVAAPDSRRDERLPNASATAVPRQRLECLEWSCPQVIVPQVVQPQIGTVRPNDHPAYRPDYRPNYRPDYRPNYQPNYYPTLSPVLRPRILSSVLHVPAARASGIRVVDRLSGEIPHILLSLRRVSVRLLVSVPEHRSVSAYPAGPIGRVIILVRGRQQWGLPEV